MGILIDESACALRLTRYQRRLRQTPEPDWLRGGHAPPHPRKQSNESGNLEMKRSERRAAFDELNDFLEKPSACSGSRPRPQTPARVCMAICNRVTRARKGSQLPETLKGAREQKQRRDARAPHARSCLPKVQRKKQVNYFNNYHGVNPLFL